MRLTAIAVLVLACLAGCVNTPQDIRETGARTEHNLAMAPEQAAGCLARNAENFGAGGASAVRALPRKGEYEVVLRLATDLGLSTLFVMEVVPAGSGSRMTIWAYKYLMQSRENAFRAEVVKGC